MEPRRLIGYWRNDEHPEYPDPADWVDDSWDADERHMVWAYLSSGTMVVAYMGLSPCRICGKNNGALEFADDVYQWPEGLAHYVYDHAIRLPEEVVRHAVARLDLLEGVRPNLDWWINATRQPDF
ncbi:hypothetical protein OG474_19470 [Kribbella sp. NBC_01505]|uniref:hypothetical protein n=1 Tax=Kribbella sp. NBC_01505 TaxID=2903580 RepID=UPI00386F8EA3